MTATTTMKKKIISTGNGNENNQKSMKNDNSDNDDLPWLEKYRPKTLDNVTGNQEIVSRLKIMAKNGNMPHLLLAGPPGTGKTTSILCLAQDLFNHNQELIKEAILELNASDDRGIETVRTRIKEFAMKKVLFPQSLSDKTLHKIIILDEVDSMTEGAQQALRRIMEIHSHSTRFALICNLSSKIIEPIQSRCAIMRYGKLDSKEMIDRLIPIMKSEGVKGNAEAIDAIIFTADGDLRQAINNLQSISTIANPITVDSVYRICDHPHPGIISKILKECRLHRLTEAIELMDQLWNLGYSPLDIVTFFFRIIKQEKSVNSFSSTIDGIKREEDQRGKDYNENNLNNEMNEFIQLEYAKIIGLCHVRIVEGLDTKLQLISMLAQMCQVANGKCDQFNNISIE